MTDGGAALFLAGNRSLFEGVVEERGLSVVETERRQFPDGETYFRVTSDVGNRKVLLFCSLDRPDSKFLPMVYAAETLREQGANSVGLLAPYLAYMRQDKAFKPGEAVTSRYFAELVDDKFDGLVTVDPHLHRYDSLDELYSIPSRVLHADRTIGRWVKSNVSKPVLIGPDSESEQWVGQIAEATDLPYTVLRKERHGDREVTVEFPPDFNPSHRQPVLVDDIVSTAGTMTQATKMLLDEGLGNPICVCVHPVFAEGAYADLRAAGADSIVSCNTIDHPSNGIDLTETVSQGITEGLT